MDRSSVHRLLSPSRRPGQSEPSTSRLPNPTPTLTLNVPGYGAHFMNPPVDPTLYPPFEVDGQNPRMDQMLNGSLDITLPVGCGRRRCKVIRVGLRTTSVLDLGPERMKEEDIIFERKAEIIGGNAEGVWLEEGLQRFEFTLILPSTLAVHDWHYNGRISHDLYGEVVGVEDASLSSSITNGLFSFGSSGRFSPSSASSRSRSHSPSPSPLHSTLASITSSLSTTRQESAIPQTPSYAQSEADNKNAMGVGSDDGWLKGIFQATRTIMLVYNPNPLGGIVPLDERTSGVAPGLGIYDIHFISDVFSICSLIRASIRLPSLSTKTSIFQVRLLLSQSHVITSPRDGYKEMKPSTKLFPIFEMGQRPPKAVVPQGDTSSTLWKGLDAEGQDEGEFKIEGKGRLPNDDFARPSTLPFINTPIEVSHALVVEIFFSNIGEDDNGLPMPVPGTSILRLMRLQRPVILPSCAIIPSVLNLPAYEDTDSRPEDHRDYTCTACRRSADVCEKHQKMDPPQIKGSAWTRKGKGWSRPTINALPSGTPGWFVCACGVGIDQMEERMRQMTLQDQDTRYQGEVEKEEAERGRRPLRG